MAEYIKVLEECIDNINREHVDARQFRRGSQSIHDIIHNKIFVADHVLCGTSNEDLERTYQDIIINCAYAIAHNRGLMPGQDNSGVTFEQMDTNSALADVDALMETTKPVVIVQTPETRTPPNPPVSNRTTMRFGERVPNKTIHTDATDAQMRQLDEKMQNLPVVSKNLRRAK